MEGEGERQSEGRDKRSEWDTERWREREGKIKGRSGQNKEKEGKMDGQVERGGNREVRDKSDKHFEL